MRRLILFVAVAVLILGGTLVLLRRVPPRGAGAAWVRFVGMTNVPPSGRLGLGTPEFPTVDLSVLAISNIPTSGRVGLFMITNGTLRNIGFSLEAVEVLQGNLWVDRACDWGRFGGLLEPGKSTIRPVPEPATNISWRIRLAIQEQARGPKGEIDRITVKAANAIVFPGQQYRLVSPSLLDGCAEPDAPPNGGPRVPQPSSEDSGGGRYR